MTYPYEGAENDHTFSGPKLQSSARCDAGADGVTASRLLFQRYAKVAQTDAKEGACSMKYRDRLSVDPQVHFGKPCIVGARILVEHVLELVQEGIPSP